MFKDANARILVTKNSGRLGGFLQKFQAAQSLGMITAVLAKPEEAGGITLEEACRRIVGFCV
jgi:precorrin-6Y C5,15-methyltransferase (decarboxylating)